MALYEYHNQVFEGGKPKVPNTDKYFQRMGWKGSTKGIHWCGIFAGYCISEGLMHSSRKVDWLQWMPGKGLKPEPKQINKYRGEPGDIVWFVRNQHYALIEKPIIEDGKVVAYQTIDGNQPAILVKPRVLVSSVHSVYSIEGWLIDENVAETPAVEDA